MANQIYTSNFAASGSNPNAVAISVGKPAGWRGRSYGALAPTRAMLKMKPDEYLYFYDEILAKLDPEKVVKDLGDGAIMLCWEGFNVLCHRRRVAEWIEDGTGLLIPEWKHERSDSLPYGELPEKAARGAKKSTRFGGGLTGQGMLF